VSVVSRGTSAFSNRVLEQCRVCLRPKIVERKDQSKGFVP
jgi:hypothetical protein